MIRHSTFIFIALAMSGCMGTEATRPCPGFGSPLADQWNTGRDVGDTITYASDTGATVSLELRSRNDSEPYVGVSHRVHADEINCRSSSDRLYNFENSDVVLRIEQSHVERDNSGREDALLFYVKIHPESPAVNSIPAYTFSFNLDVQSRQQKYTDSFNPDHRIDVSPLDSRSIENVQIGNNLYPYAVEQKYLNLEQFTNVTDINSLATITRVIVAEGAGLVQFELLSGEVYSRI